VYKNDFRQALNDADQKSSSDPLYAEMQGQMNVANHKVVLKVHLTPWVDHVMEGAIRDALGDRRQETHPDAVFRNVEIEIKHSSTEHRQFPNDSVGVRRVTDKWYFFTEGSLDLKKKKEYKIWTIRSDFLYDELYNLANKQQSMGFTPAKSINTSTMTRDAAITAIEQEIDLIKSDLARTIFNKATGVSRSQADERNHMSLRSGVNVNSVRFDVKFGPLSEKLIREIVSEIIKG